MERSEKILELRNCQRFIQLLVQQIVKGWNYGVVPVHFFYMSIGLIHDFGYDFAVINLLNKHKTEHTSVPHCKPTYVAIEM